MFLIIQICLIGCTIDDDEPIPDFLDLDELNAEITSELFEEIDDGDLPF